MKLLQEGRYLQYILEVADLNLIKLFLFVLIRLPSLNQDYLRRVSFVLRDVAMLIMSNILFTSLFPAFILCSMSARKGRREHVDVELRPPPLLAVHMYFSYPQTPS
jgi:hypothetical protein